MDYHVKNNRRKWSRCFRFPEVPESLFVSVKCEHLIKYPIQKYKLPRHFNDKVELDLIPSLAPHVTSLNPYRPFLVNPTKHLLNSNSNCKCDKSSKMMMVIGTREIFEKRERIQKLRLLAGLSTIDGNDPDNGDSCKIKLGEEQLMMLHRDRDQYRHRPTNEFEFYPVTAPGGAAAEEAKTDAKEDKETQAGPAADTVAEEKTATDAPPPPPPEKESKTDSGKEAKTDAGKETKKPDPDSKDKKEKETKVEKTAKKTKAPPPPKEATIIIDITVIERPEVEQRFLQEEIPEEDHLPEIVKVSDEVKKQEDEEVKLLAEDDVIIPEKLGAGDERDNEWLSLSDSDMAEADERREVERLYKEKESWMIRGISYESQHLVDVCKIYLWSSKLTGRSPFYTKPDYRNRIVEFVVNRRRELLYFSTSIILWIFYVLIIQGVFDILLISVGNDYSEKETSEFQRHLIPLLLVIGQMTVVAFWSVLVLLNYGLRMTHYFNTWNLAVTEMEINAGAGVKALTVVNHVWLAMYFFVIILCFIIDTPVNVRGAMQLLTVFLIRNFSPNVLETSSPFLVKMLQIVGLVLYLYIAYCVRIIYNLLYIFATVLRNSSEMWNLKFALKFTQIPTSNSGFLRLLKARQTLSKIWLHHRLLTGLCVQLGDVFAMPIMLSFVMQLGAATWCMVYLFNQAYIDYSKRENEYNSMAHTRFGPIVSRKSTKLEDTLTAIFVLVYFILDFCINSYFITTASEAFRDGFEFVRRRGLILCTSSHERRLIQSLQWSFSAVSASQINLVGFFSVSRETMLNFLSIMLLLWSLIIQLQAEKLGAIVVYAPNCSIKPKGKIPVADNDGFCRKKIWVGEFSLDSEIERIKGIKNPDENLVEHSNQVRRRRRRDLGYISDFDLDLRHSFQTIEATHPSAPAPAPGNNGNVPDKPVRISWLATSRYIPEGYVDGNCLKNKLTNLQKLSYQNYYRHFHEPCYSPYLNVTFMVPKLYGERQHVWLGRKAVDCGIYPFPLPVLFRRDCSGQLAHDHLEDYDDCGWRKTVVDDIVFSTGKKLIKMVTFHFKNGNTFKCWNIFTALKRCKRIGEMNNGPQICQSARNPQVLNNKLRLLRPRDYFLA